MNSPLDRLDDPPPEVIVTRGNRTLRRLRDLYYGTSPAARRFRFAMLGFDLVAITYFVASTVTGPPAYGAWIDAAIGVVLLADLFVRLLIVRNRWAQLARLPFWIDAIVIASLFGSALVPHLAFARVLRMLRVLRSYRLLLELRRNFVWFRNQEEIIESALNLVVFVFITTSLVFLVERPGNPQVETFLDALYFTIATLTTTGFGDITPIGSAGKLLSIAIMVVGVSLFLRLIQALFRPAKVQVECQRCGLARHDLDAVHCKHCGEIINIPTEGAV